MDNFESIANIRYLNKDNSRFTASDGFISLEITSDAMREELQKAEMATNFERVIASKCFPFDEDETHIAVTDQDQKEIGLINSLSDLDESSAEAIRAELKRRYFTRKITEIIKLKEHNGRTNWKVMTDAGEVEFVVRDIATSLIRAGSGRFFIEDIDGNIYEIVDLYALPSKSVKTLEIYI